MFVMKTKTGAKLEDMNPLHGRRNWEARWLKRLARCAFEKHIEGGSREKVL